MENIFTTSGKRDIQGLLTRSCKLRGHCEPREWQFIRGRLFRCNANRGAADDFAHFVLPCLGGGTLGVAEKIISMDRSHSGASMSARMRGASWLHSNASSCDDILASVHTADFSIRRYVSKYFRMFQSFQLMLKNYRLHDAPMSC